MKNNFDLVLAIAKTDISLEENTRELKTVYV